MTASARTFTPLKLANPHCKAREFVTLTFPKYSFGILVADTEAGRDSASALLNQRYAWRGYGTGIRVGEDPQETTFVATDSHTNRAIGTLTVGLDGARGLLADRLYNSEVQRLREQGRRLCEIVKFAVDCRCHSKCLLASMFHVAFIHAYELQGSTDLVIEVTPQHAQFYQHMLGFEQVGSERLNPRVNTRGVLLRLDLVFSERQICSFGGQGANSGERSLYPYAFSAHEAAVIHARMSAGAGQFAAAA